MYRLLLLAIFIAATAVWAQDPTSEEESAASTETEAAEELAEVRRHFVDAKLPPELTVEWIWNQGGRFRRASAPSQA